MKLLFFCTVMVLTVANGSQHAWPDPTRGGSGVNLNGKMFTLSRYKGGFVLFSPYQPSPWASTPSYQTTGYTSGYYSTSTPSYTQTNTGKTKTSGSFTATKSNTTPPTTTYPSWSTAPTTRGVSVCLRYITDSESSIFTLSPSSSRLRLDVSGTFAYSLTFNDYSSAYLKPNIRLWSDLRPNMWTRICLTVDNVKGVVQMFRDSSMSIRKRLTYRYMWSGEPVIDFSDFEGQVTDVQVWDYPLSFKEAFYYMSSGLYGSYRGSVLNWSHVSYSITGMTLLEDSYEQQIRQPNRRRGRGRHLNEEEKPRKLHHMKESKGRKRFDV
ncbi:hypothetical protein CRENBAI_011010 [Crenichthys baileyi]|uniref:Pentraxin (PTX) domain-containing protein n=1 Tax=Crenichthys baileyi TaxID=28760 RepID=A0AAV9QUA5_9TELE